MNSGIYTITNLIDNKIYVGQSKNIKNRLYTHKTQLKNKKHDNTYLQNAVNKYGIENFEFELLEEHDLDFLNAMEHYWCNLLNSHNKKYGYNIEPTSPFGRLTMSEETKNKISIAHTGKKGIFPTEEARKNMSLGQQKRIPKKHSEETKKKIGNKSKGRIKSKETIEKIRNKTKGQKRNSTTKEKMSLSSIKRGFFKNLSKEDRLLHIEKYEIPIIQLNKKDKSFIKKWKGRNYASKELNISISAISNNLNGYSKSAGGFIWVEEKEYFH